jgi:hypothetical protein
MKSSIGTQENTCVESDWFQQRQHMRPQIDLMRGSRLLKQRAKRSLGSAVQSLNLDLGLRFGMKSSLFAIAVFTLGVCKSHQVAAASGELLIGYEYQSTGGRVKVPESGCRLKLSQKGTKRTVFVSLPPAQASARAQLAPGEWLVERLGCGLGKVWDLDDLFPNGLIVQTGRVNAVGKLILEIPEVSLVRRTGEVKGETPSKVRLAARGESLSWLESAAGSMGAIGSAFTGKTLSDTKAISSEEGPLGRDGFRLEAIGLSGGESQARTLLAPLQTRLLNCTERESASDPLRLGRIRWDVKYVAGKPSAANEVESRHAFRDEFINCLKGAIADVALGSANLELRISY